jgi:hypothetical protein
MTLVEFSIITAALVGLAILRFGLPLLVIWVFQQFCGRVLHLSS